ncbi:MAG TPA: hypothetical protein VN176_13210 [Verrucomicrobiae bacterium]|jgi:hypothetical protein|nr:hypothetical protein [Verrucomicrobiae bacterium]
MKHEVIASLEGARIVISDGTCQLDEYDFAVNRWNPKEQQPWPLSKEQATRWLHGWNRVDGFKAFHLLVRPQPD